MIELPAADRDYFLVLALTGQRRQEIGSLSWDEVDLERRIVTLPAERVKNGHEHVLPISKQVAKILRDRLANSRSESRYVFSTATNPLPYSESKRVYERIEDILGADCNPHALRRTFATIARHQCQIEYDIVKRCLNHTSGHITDKYIQRDPEQLRAACQAVSDFFFSTVGYPEKPYIRLSLDQVKTG